MELISNIPYGEGEERDAWGSIEYPFTLSYTLPDGEAISIVIENEGQSEDEYHKMFSLCGHDVAFRVDEVSVPAAEVVSRLDLLNEEFDVFGEL